MIRAIVAANVVKLRDAKYRAIPTITGRNRQLAIDVGTTLSQIQRITKRELGTSIDQIEALANVFLVSPADLLTPYLKAEHTITHVQHATLHESSEGLRRG